MLRPSMLDRHNRTTRGLRRALTLFALASALLMVAPADARAQCGGVNEPACTTTTCILRGLFGNCLAWRTTRSCDSDRLNVRLTLQGYQCQACGGPGQPRCDSGAACSAGNVLGPLEITCHACGGDGELACGGGVCDAGTRNVLGTCRVCGDAGQIACSGGTCSAGTRNILGICTLCGGPGQSVCTEGEDCRGRTNREGLGDAALCVACGGPFQRPCELDFPACDVGLSHMGLGEGRCVPFDCGEAGQVACSGGICREGTRNVLGICTACGEAGQIACSDGFCSENTRNILGI